MRYCSFFLLLRSLLSVLLLAALGSCSVYHKVVHPYRLPTPKPSPEFRAQQKADKKARKSNQIASLFKKKPAVNVEEAATDVSGPTGGDVAANPVATPETRTLPEHATVHYDKAGLMKNKPQLMRRRIHKPSKPFRPWQAIRNFFKFGLHAKPNYSPDHRPVPKPVAPADAPAPDGASPEAAPDAAPEPAAEPAPPKKP